MYTYDLYLYIYMHTCIRTCNVYLPVIYPCQSMKERYMRKYQENQLKSCVPEIAICSIDDIMSCCWRCLL